MKDSGGMYANGIVLFIQGQEQSGAIQHLLRRNRTEQVVSGVS
ncbi:hypothetical protein ACTXGQ_16640 [Marinobacter sp. 1Y8]